MSNSGQLRRVFKENGRKPTTKLCQRLQNKTSIADWWNEMYSTFLLEKSEIK